MKINWWCGRRVLDGHFNIDAAHNPKAPRAPELVHALAFKADGSVANPVPLGDGCADYLQAMHAIEHVHEWEAPHLLAEFMRLLRSGGTLVLELPNVEAAARNLLAGEPPNMWSFPLYGDGSHKDPYMCHKFGYTPKTLKALVAEAGFIDIRLMAPQTHGPRPNRDMRLEARKA